MGHAHGHANDPGTMRRSIELGAVRRVLAVAVGLAALAAVAGLVLLRPGGEGDLDRTALGFAERVDATVTFADVEPCTADPEADCAVVTARVTSGDSAGESATIETSADAGTAVTGLAEGDEIVLNDAGADVPAEARWTFADMQRTMPLVVLAIVFCAVVVALGRLRGLFALVGIALSMGVLLLFIFPALLDGSPPILVALTGATVIAFGTLYLAHGFNERTTVALLGTLASLALTAALAVVFAGATELSGLASEESVVLLTAAPDLDFRGLLLAAVILGTLGVLDDVTVTQVSAVWELRRTDPSLGRRALYAAGIRIGRDHIASTVNTLVLAYTAAALPLLLIYTQSGLGLGGVLTTETVAVEIVQTLVGSIGLVASVPLTTALACWVGARAAVPMEGAWTEDAGAIPVAGGWAGPAPWPEPELKSGAAPWGQPALRRGQPDPGPYERDDEFWTNEPW